jgi:hypothetical protein
LQGETDGEAGIETGRGTVTGIETGIEIEEHEVLGVAVVPVAAAEAEAVHAVVVVGAVTRVAAEVVAGNGAGKGQGVAVPETGEMIDQASWMINRHLFNSWCQTCT